MYESFDCPVCKQEKAFEFGSGDCQTCDDCCCCYWHNETEIMIRCFPYGLDANNLKRYDKVKREKNEITKTKTN